MAGTTFLDNIYGQPDSLREVARYYGSHDGRALLDQAARLLDGKVLTSTGMGASLFALLATRPLLDAASPGHLIEETGYLSENRGRLSREVEAALVVTQSGETVEAKALLFADAPKPTIVLTRNTSSSVAAAADLVMPMACEPDLSVAVQTYTSTVAVLALLAARLEGSGVESVVDGIRCVADEVEKLIPRMAEEIPAVADYVVDAQQIYAVGRGTSLGTALGTGLLLKEAAKRNCEGGGSAQFRHGAVEVLSDQTAVIVFATTDERTRRLDENLVGEIESYGAPVVVVGEDVPSHHRGVYLPTTSAALRPIVEIIPMQFLSYALAHRNGVTPGEFRNTVPVIATA